MADFTDHLALDHQAMIARRAVYFSVLPGTRQIFGIAAESVQASCGWSVPIMHVGRPREAPVKYHARSDPAQWTAKMARRPTGRYIAGR